MRPSVVALLCVAASLAACGAPDSESAPADEGPRSTPSSPVTGTTDVTKGEILFRDDFSSPTSGWEVEEEDYQATGYRDGVYFIRFTDDHLVTKQEYPGGELADAVIEATATITEPAAGGKAGLYARYDGERLFRIMVDTEGRVGAGLSVYDGYSLPALSFEPSEHVKTDGPNRLAIRLAGETVELSVNGHLVASVTDSAPAAGALGVIASSAEPGFEATFDDFLVASP